MPRAMGPDRRSFTVVASSTGEAGGRYVSATPYGAARKAARILFSVAREGHMQIQEITRGSAGRVYSYASIIELNNKVVMFRDASGAEHQIVRKYVVRVTKLTEDEYMRLGASPSAAARHLLKKKRRASKRRMSQDDVDTDSSSEVPSSEASSDVSSEGENQRGGDDFYY